MEIIQHLHSILRWLLLILLVYSIWRSYTAMSSKQAFTASDHKAALFLMITTDLQLLLGLALYFLGALGLKNIQNTGMGEVMKNSYARFFAMEHLLMMLIAIVFIHIGKSATKTAGGTDGNYKKAFWCYLIALLLILVSIPWPFRAGFESRAWF